MKLHNEHRLSFVESTAAHKTHSRGLQLKFTTVVSDVKALSNECIFGNQLNNTDIPRIVTSVH